MERINKHEETLVAKINRIRFCIEKNNIEGLQTAIAEEGISFFSQFLEPIKTTLIAIAVQHNYLPTIQLLMKNNVGVQGNDGNRRNLLECALFAGLYKENLSDPNYVIFVTQLLNKGLRLNPGNENNANLLLVLQSKYSSIYALLQDYKKYDEQQQVKQAQGGGWFSYLSSLFGVEQMQPPRTDIPLYPLSPAIDPKSPASVKTF